MSLKRTIIRAAKPIIERLPSVAMTYRYLRDHQRPPAEVPMTPMGFRLAGHALMQSGRFEVVETAFVRALLPQVDLFVNVGANIGYYCCTALHAGKEVIAFEPSAANLRHLYQNVRANGWGHRIEVFPLALAGASDVLTFYGGGVMASLVSGWAGTPTRYAESVACSTLDRLVLPRLKGQRVLILVDVEGAEEAMLRGARDCLAVQPRPVWIVEVCIDEHLPAPLKVNPKLVATFQHFFEHGYIAWTCEAKPRRVTADEIERIAASSTNTLTTHNFVFADPTLALPELRLPN